MPFSKRGGGAGLTACLAIASALILAVFWKFLVFHAAYLFKDIAADSINVDYPQLRHLFDYWRTDGMPGWSFSQGLGQDLYPLGWNDPFFLVLIPFSGKSLPFGFIYMEAAKILAAGVFAYLWLRETELTDAAAVAGALLFSFSGFMIVGGPWMIFTPEAVDCAFLLFAFERFLKRGDWRWLPAPLALLSLLRPYLLFPYALFFGLYATARFLDERGWKPRELAAFLWKFLLSAALGVLLAGAQLLSDLRQILQSPRASGPASLFKVYSAKPVFGLAGSVQALTGLFRLYSSDLLGTGSAFRGWGNYLEAPLNYCGLACLLLAPQAFAAMDARRRRIYGALTGLAVAPMIFPYFRHLFWAFSGDYYRTYSLFVVVLLVFFAARGLSELQRGGRARNLVLGASLAAALAGLLFVPAAFKAPVDLRLAAALAGLLVADAVLIFLLGVKKYARAALAVLLASIILEAGAASRRTVDSRDVLTAEELAAKSGYNDFTVDALAAIRAGDPSFYRVEKDYRSNPTRYRGFNDPKAQGYFGSSTYAQFNQESSLAFLSELDVLDRAKETDTRWIRGLRDREKLMTLAGVKYYLSKKPAGERPEHFADGALGTFGDVTVYQNRRALPLGFTYDRCLPFSRFHALETPAKEAALLDAFVPLEGQDCLGFPQLASANAAARDGARGYDAAVRERRKDVLAVSSWSQNSVEGSIDLPARKLLFFSIPQDAGWSARVDGKPAPLLRIDVGFMGLPLEAGRHDVALRFDSPLKREGRLLSLLALGLYGFLLFRRRRVS
ncbi:MAG TPA: YfhO family protein [Elusimicrobiota bacterium]|nr:YfhO family protein [Elusimicrobiota bacterium]